MMKLSVISLVLLIVMSINAVSSEVRLVSPIGAVVRSSIPGWGQLYTNHKVKAFLVFMSVAAFSLAGLREDVKFRQAYRDYREAVYSERPDVSHYFDKANDHYKLSRFFLYTAAGIWAYGVIDAYIDAHIYNAKQKRELLRVDDEKLQEYKKRESLIKQ